MYAIIRSGGKQYKVEAGDTLRVEKLEKELGSEFELDEVLVIGGEKTFVGEPVVQGAKVTVVVTRQAKAPKVIVFKKKRRQGYRRMKGHRQMYTELFVKSITNPEGQVIEADKAAKVFSPEKKAARAEKSKEAFKARTEEAPQRAEVGSGAKKTAAQQTGVKKTAAKKSGAKKSGAKKKAAAKKKTATKKSSAKKKAATKKSSAKKKAATKKKTRKTKKAVAKKKTTRKKA